MIDECYYCKYATEYCAYYWFPSYDPTCELGNPMRAVENCPDYKRLGDAKK